MIEPFVHILYNGCNHKFEGEQIKQTSSLVNGYFLIDICEFANIVNSLSLGVIYLFGGIIVCTNLKKKLCCQLMTTFVF